MTARCYVFVKSLNEDGCFSVLVNNEAATSEAAFYSFNALKVLDAEIIIVLSTEDFSLHWLELPQLNEKKARLAIPFALEEKLTENIDQLHFFFDSHHYKNGHYLVGVCNKTFFTELMEKLKGYEFPTHTVTLDWFALDENENWIINNGLLINNPSLFIGFLNAKMAPLYFEQLTEEKIITSFEDSDPALSLTSNHKIEQTFYSLAGQRLQKNSFINCCQGELSNQKKNTDHFWYKAAAGMTLLWVITFFVFNGLTLYRLNHEIFNVDKQIATIYHQFFPQAEQVISPRFRIEQLLKSNKTAGDSALWVLLNNLAKSTENEPITIKQLRFQNTALQVTINTPDFAILEKFQTNLKANSIQVKQLQASTQSEAVVSTLELNL